MQIFARSTTQRKAHREHGICRPIAPTREELLRKVFSYNLANEKNSVFRLWALDHGDTCSRSSEEDGSETLGLVFSLEINPSGPSGLLMLFEAAGS